MAFADIKLGSTFDAKGFKQAQTATDKLTKNVKNLAGAFGLAFGTAAVVRFGKAAVKAFAEDEKSAVALTQTLKNLSLGFANVGIEDFITKMSLATGVADDQLRPAFQKLVQTNLDYAASQKLIALALDISAAGFGDVVSVAGTLSQAMVGNVKGLKQFNLGISQAELSTMTFDQLLEKLTKTFKGQAAAAADTYAGKLNIIKNAAGEAQESIGKGLIDALMKIGNNKDMQGLTDDILAAGQGISYLISGIGDLVKAIGSVPGFGFEGVGKNAPMPFTLNPLAILAQKAYKDQLSATYKLEEKRLKNALKMKWIMGAAVNPTKDSILTFDEARAGMTPSQKRKIIADKKAAVDAAKARAVELARIKALALAKSKTDKLVAANASKLAKAQSIFNMDQIQIEAALKGKISENERLRLQLQRAILNEDYVLAEKLQKQLEASQRAIGALQGQLAAVKPAANPFDAWIKSLEEIQLSLEKLYKTDSGKIIPFVSKDTTNMTTDQLVVYTQEVADAATAAATEALKTETYGRNLAELLAAGSSSLAGYAAVVGGRYDTNLGDMTDFIPTGGQTAFSGGSSVTVNVQGSVLNGNDFVDIVNNALLDSQRQGRSQVAAGALP